MANLELEPGWKAIEDWKLSEIASEMPDVLMELTRYTLQQVRALKLKIDLIESYLDQSAFLDIKLKFNPKNQLPSWWNLSVLSRFLWAGFFQKYFTNSNKKRKLCILLVTNQIISTNWCKY